MKKKALIISIVVFFLVAVVGGYTAFNSIFPKAEPIESPAPGDILSVTVAVNGGDAVAVNGEDSPELLHNINKAQSTRKMSVNDSPAVSPYYLITVCTSEREYYYFVYEYASQVYIEMPYEGVYRSHGRMLDLVMKYCT